MNDVCAGGSTHICIYRRAFLRDLDFCTRFVHCLLSFHCVALSPFNDGTRLIWQRKRKREIVSISIYNKRKFLNKIMFAPTKIKKKTQIRAVFLHENLPDRCPFSFDFLVNLDYGYCEIKKKRIANLRCRESNDPSRLDIHPLLHVCARY